jgi:hypothetical protein
MKSLLTLVFISFCSVSVLAGMCDSAPVLNFPMPYDKIVEGKDVNVYGDDSLFVECPAKTGFVLGDTIGVLVGIPTGFIIGFPYFIITEFDEPENTLLGCYFGWGITGIPLREGLGTLISSPFYGLKKVFWDAPVYLWESVLDEDKSNQKPSGNPAPPGS